MITIYSAKVVGAAGNCRYPIKVEVNDAATMKCAVSKDYVCAKYKDDYRSNENFISSNCLPCDCDNDHSEDPEKWVSLDDVKEAFPDVRFFVHYSRNHNREKGGKKARPKFHILFEIDEITDSEAYSALKSKVIALFPYFDHNAADSARFFFGTDPAQVEVVEGKRTLTDFIDEEAFDECCGGAISEGSRNSTMSRFAARVLKRQGDTDEAHEAFLEEAEKCEPPLEDDELSLIWNSARKFYKKISQASDYVPPEVYNDETDYKPDDYSDVGQAEVLAKHYKAVLRYSPQTHFIKYRNNYWQETEPGAQAVAQELTKKQLKDARRRAAKAYKALEKLGVFEMISTLPKGKVEGVLSKEQKEAYSEYMDARAYETFSLKRRDSKNISATLKESHPLIEIDYKELDADPFLLCTPNATYDLKKGMKGAREHSPDDFLTKVTNVSPSLKGKKEWLDTLDKIFSGDNELIEYVQMICGLASIGKVYVEALIIAYGEGGNGKSTFWNAIAKVLGLYYGNISADTLTVNCRRNIKPEMAEVKGKRLLIAAESQEGARLNDSTVKQLCSTDDIFAEKKYKDPFSFKPCHTLVLYTNHLPRVSASDDGIWRRLIVIPFKNKLTGDGDIKNYGEILYENAGEFILYWIIEGAKKVIDLNYQIKAPKCVQDAINEYKEQNDWFHHFLEDRCEIDPKGLESSAALYAEYRRYCVDNNEFTRSTTDFYEALERNNFTKLDRGRKRQIRGLRLKIASGDFEKDGEDLEDFLT